MKPNDVVIVSAMRTPIGDFLGSLKNVQIVDLAVAAVNAAINKAGIDASLIDELACGCIYKHAQGGNPARQIQIKAGIGSDKWAYTIDQQCASGMKAFELIYQSLILGKAKMGLVVGAESMSNSPYLLTKARNDGYRMGNGVLIDSMLNDGLICAMEKYHMGVTAENLAKEYNITREEQDELALLSHTRAIASREKGIPQSEIVPIEVKNRKKTYVVNMDEHPKADITMETLRAAKPAFIKDGSVTAGNASSINDGAAAIVMTTNAVAMEYGLTPLAKVLSTANFGVEPRIMGIGPAYAIPKALELAGLKIEDIDYFEINEAFAAQFLAVNRVLKLSMDKVNRNGSGIGIGHPVGCTGARIVQALISELKYSGSQYGVASLCVGGGPSMAVVLENIQ